MTDLSQYKGFIEQYMVELKELTFNSKPIINNLTMLAEEHRNIAPSIAAAIEHHLSSCPPASKLPVLYLLDSIAKNVREPFVSAFARNLPEVFSQIWTALPQAHPQLLKLLNTWTGLFPGGTLAALRRSVGQPEAALRPSSAPAPGYQARPCKMIIQADSTLTVAKLVESSTALRAKHLDQWYLKQRRLKDAGAANQSQHWFVDENTWLRGTTTDAKAAPDFYEEDQEDEAEASEPVDDSQPNCGLSGEKFDIFWDDESEQWRYRDAKRLLGPEAVKYGVADGTLVKRSRQ
ncbi:hypothetical protein WJX73_005583 [Symbiochloris irregularis]|uniref:CID domain-containing protein n=1 Tax=Symbiochloris irregularis TaxID=706552 RepID=A0AAW1PKE1_9CHLO